MFKLIFISRVKKWSIGRFFFQSIKRNTGCKTKTRVPIGLNISGFFIACQVGMVY